MTEEGRRRAAAALRVEAERRGLTPQDLADLAGRDVGTVRDLLNGERWPRVSTRNDVEAALGWPQGRIGELAAADTQPAVEANDDPVWLALHDSPLRLAAKHEVYAHYLRLLEEPDQLVG